VCWGHVANGASGGNHISVRAGPAQLFGGQSHLLPFLSFPPLIFLILPFPLHQEVAMASPTRRPEEAVSFHSGLRGRAPNAEGFWYIFSLLGKEMCLVTTILVLFVGT